MSKVRVLLVEADGIESSVIEKALQSFGLAPAFPVAPPAVEIPAPVVDPARTLPTPPAVEGLPARPEAKRQRRTRRKGASGKSGASSASPAPAAPAQDSACKQAILAVLAKGPRTSMELVNITKFMSGSVYPALKALRDDGRVEMWEDPADGQRKNRLRV